MSFTNDITKVTNFYFFGKMFAYKIRFAVEKKTKKFAKNFVSPSKKASHTISIYGNCMESIFFFQKNILNHFFLSPVCSTVLKKPQKWFNFFSIVFRKCMKIVCQEFSPYTWCMDLYDNDFCCMELYDKHFRCMEVKPGYFFFFFFFISSDKEHRNCQKTLVKTLRQAFYYWNLKIIIFP